MSYQEYNWYSVVTFGAPTAYTVAHLGTWKVGSRVSRDYSQCLRRARALSGHVTAVRILGCQTREQARQVIWSI